MHLEDEKDFKVTTYQYSWMKIDVYVDQLVHGQYCHTLFPEAL